MTVRWKGTHMETTVLGVGLPPFFIHYERLLHVRNESSNRPNEELKGFPFLLRHIHWPTVHILRSRWG